MKPLKSRSLYVVGACLLVGGTAQTVLADAKPNPYQAIIERNPFGLKPPPPPPDIIQSVPVVPLGKVILTGIITLFGPTPRALLEITEQEPGKTATTRKPILHEGEHDGAVEVLSIDVEKSIVKIRNAGIETNISFETPKMAAGPGPAAPAVPGGFLPPPATASMPTVISPAYAAANNLGRSSGVTVVGGGTAAAPAAASFGTPFGGNSGMVPAGNSGVTLGGYTPPAIAANSGNGLNPIPSRTLRTDSPTTVNPGQRPDAAKQYLDWSLQHEIQTSLGKPFPPPPPLPE